MGRRKAKSLKKTKKRSRSEDVKASTSLPPSVDGQLRCFLRVTLSKIQWETKKPPDVFSLRLKWWGEQTDGSLFRPWDGREETKSSARKTARYPIRCGPKQFAEYLNAMSTCVLELLKGDQMTCIGKATVCELGVLAPQNPISGSYPIFSNLKAEKLAEVTVSMRFEPLPVSYDSSSSVPTTDISLPTHSGHTTDGSTVPQSILKKPSQVAPDGLSSSKGGTRQGRQTPSGIDDDYSFVIGPGAGSAKIGPSIGERPKQLPQPVKVISDSAVSDSGTEVLSIPKADPSPEIGGRYEVRPTSVAGKHLISTILDKGNRLMDSMIKAQCVAQPKGPEVPKSDPSSSVTPSAPATYPLRRSSSGELFRELLKDEAVLPGGPPISIPNPEERKESVDPTLQMVIGDNITEKELRHLKAMSGTSPIESDFSEGFDGLSTDSDDPLHEDSILEELFYKGQRTSSDSGSLSDLLLSSDSEGEAHGRRRKLKKEKFRKKRTEKESGSEKQNETSPGLEHKLDGSLFKAEKETSAKGKGTEELSNSASDEDTSSVGTLLHRSSTGMEGLSVQRLTLLGRVHAARVAIDSLTLTKQIPSSSAKSRIPQRVSDNHMVRGKPPRPHVKSTYFVEYQFPVTASSEDNMATEVMRVVSKKVLEKNGKCDVQFGHRSVFPVQFDGSTVDHWWTRLLVMRIYHKLAGQKTPSLIAVASTPLRSILRSPDFSVTFDLPVMSKDASRRLSTSMSSSTTADTTTTSLEENNAQLGIIKVSIELTSDSKDFSAALTRMKVAELKGAKVITLPTAQRPGSTSGDRQGRKGRGREKRHPSTESVKTGMSEVKRMVMTSDPRGGSVNDESLVREKPYNQQENEHLTLHTLLLVTEGHGITVQGVKPLTAHIGNQHSIPYNTQNGILNQGRDFVTRNPYLICKMFWSDDAVHSHVCWGTTEPQFNFSQVAPVLLTPSLLERTRNNFMVVEVWDKKTSGQNDVLIGIAKLPLHQFYMSFRDQKIADAILKSQYPVVGIDNYAPVVNPFSGVHYGQIKVLLAMGAYHQISSLQRLKGDAVIDVPKPERPFHYLERSENSQHHTKGDQEENAQVEHIFEVVIEGIRSLPQGENFVWGEADCFVQYHFPSQEKQYNHLQGSLSLRSFRTATTLCLPDPVFNDVTRHRIPLPQNVPVQRELLTACVGVGGAAGYIPLELWCRYYYPNVRDQVIAKAFLPLAKLCAMVTMQRRGEPSIQTFNLPLKAQQESDNTQVSSGGFLDVTVSYKQSPLSSTTTTGLSSLSSFPQVTLTVAVLRATGLQAAAMGLARYHPSLQYSCDVGVNSFTTVQLSFLPKEELKRSQTIARSFAPELSHHMDFSCPIILQDRGQMSGETPLAEVLETADVIVKLWHQVQQSHGADHQFDLYPGEEGVIAGRQLVAPPREILLGTTTIPMRNLLLKRTGINGWFTLTPPPLNGWHSDPRNHDRPTDDETTSPQGDNRDGGSIELVLRFAQKTDREKVIQVGQRMGWIPPMSLDDEETSEYLSLPVNLSLQIDQVLFHEQSVLRPGQTHISEDCHVYVRYQFYDRRPTYSALVPVKLSHDGQLSANVTHVEKVNLTMNPSLTWYMKEEQFVVQVWVSQSAKKDSLPKKSNKQIGSAHIDMTSLVTEGSRHRKISGLHALSKPGVSNMYGACLRGTIMLKVGQVQHSSEPCFRPLYQGVVKIDFYIKDWDLKRISSEEDDVHAQHADEGKEVVEGAVEETDLTPPPPEEPEPEIIEPAPFELHIERAMGLCTSPQRWNATPLSTYVTLAVGDGDPIMTPTVPDTTRPVWNYYQEVLLNPQEVVEKQHLIFKVWHQTTGRQDMSCDRMLGFTSVDLGPILVGFRSLNGWYNIMDFSSQVKGQIKIAITPKRDLSMLKQRAVQFMGQNHSPTTLSHLLPQYSIHRPPPGHVSFGRHHQEHVRGVRESHERLHSRKHTQERAEDPSLSRLKENLRRNLADLDSLKEHLDKKRRGLDGHGMDMGTTIAIEAESRLTGPSTERPLDKLTEHRIENRVYGEVSSGRTHLHSACANQNNLGDVDIVEDVQYHRRVEPKEVLQEEETDIVGSIPSESLEDSESEREGDIVIPKTLNDIVLDGTGHDQRGQWDEKEEGIVNLEDTSSSYKPPDVIADEGAIQETWDHGEDKDIEESESVMNSEETIPGYETPEEALERIQQRIMKVVGPQVSGPHWTTENIHRNRGVSIDHEAQEASQPPEMFHQAVSILRGREDGVDPIDIEEPSSILSESLSEREELVRFASSPDEGESVEMLKRGSRDGSMSPSPKSDGYLEGDEKPCNGRSPFGEDDFRRDLEKKSDSDSEPEGTSNLASRGSVVEHHEEEGTFQAARKFPNGEENLPSGYVEKAGTQREDYSPVKSAEEYYHPSGPTKDDPVAFKLPNFFLPREDLASAMRTLENAVSGPPATTERLPEVGSLSERIQAAREVTRRMEEGARADRNPGQMNHPKKYARAQPTAEEAKRIARIFSTKYSPP